MNVLETLKCVRKVLERPEAWTQGTYARDVLGDPCEATSPAARSFCLIGAVKKCVNEANDFRPVVQEALGALYAEPVLMPVWLTLRFNDIVAQTHGDILAFLDAAIARQGDKA